MEECATHGMILNRCAASVVLFATVNIEVGNIDKMAYRHGISPDIWKLTLREALRFGKYLIRKVGELSAKWRPSTDYLSLYMRCLRDQ